MKLFLERDQEVTVAGSRPSAFARIPGGGRRAGPAGGLGLGLVGVRGGLPGTGPDAPAVRLQQVRRTAAPATTSVPTNLAGSRAWRAPNHPQACFLTMAVLDDLADELGLDPIDFLERNLDLTGRADTYREQLAIAGEMASWKEALAASRANARGRCPPRARRLRPHLGRPAAATRATAT